MAKLKTEPTYRAFSTKKETTYGSSIAWGSAAPLLSKHMDPPVWQKRGEMRTNKDEYTGYAGITEKAIAGFLVEFTHEQRLRPHEATLFMALLLGSVSTAQQGATAAYRHDIERQSAVEMPSVTMWQANPLTGNKVFAGIGCKQVVVRAEEHKEIKLSGSMFGDGSMQAGVDISGGSHPTDESYLSWEDCDLLIGGTFDGSDVTSGTSIKDLVRDLTLTITSPNEGERQFGGDGTYYDAIIRADDKPEDHGVLAVNLTPAGTTYLDYLAAETEAVMEFKIVGSLADTGYYFTTSWVFPVSRVMKSDVDRDRSIMTADLEWHSLKDDSANDYEEVHFYGINKVTEYLGAVA